MSKIAKAKLDKIFKAYDIRGLARSELSADIAFAVGRAFADYLPAGEVVVGRDIRGYSQELSDAMMAGLLRQGRKVIDIGLVTSDMVYYAVGSLEASGGAMITASHNPGAYDGIKLTAKGVVPIGIESGLLEIQAEVASEVYKKTCEEGCKTGEISQVDITTGWVTHAIAVAGAISEPLHVGIDTGNGMAGIVLDDLDKLTELKIIGLYTDLDGTFPHHPANPIDAANLKDLQKLVVSKGLELGIAFDTDGDRAFAIDERGNALSASVMGAIIAKDMLEREPGQTVLYNVTCSDIVPATIEGFGGHSVRTRTGHSFIKAEMKAHGASLGVESSGHFYFADNYNADSGLIVALRLCKIVSESEKPLSELAAPFVSMFANSPELNFTVFDPKESLKVLERHFSRGDIDQLDGLTVRFRDWWFNARPSNTEPYLRVNIEADNVDILREHQREITRLLREKRSRTKN